MPGAGGRRPAKARALDHLYQGQSNDCYWHGLFGGIYIAHMRMATLSHLIAAEDLADTAEAAAGRRSPTARGWPTRTWTRSTRSWSRRPRQTVVVDLAEGAGISSWDLRASRVALASVHAAPAGGLPRAAASRTRAAPRRRPGRRRGRRRAEAAAASRRPGRSTTSSRPRSPAWRPSSTTTATSAAAASSTCSPPTARTAEQLRRGRLRGPGRLRRGAPSRSRTARRRHPADGWARCDPPARAAGQIGPGRHAHSLADGREDVRRSAAIAERRRSSWSSASRTPARRAARLRAGRRVERQPAGRRPQPGGLLRATEAATREPARRQRRRGLGVQARLRQRLRGRQDRAPRSNPPPA